MADQADITGRWDLYKSENFEEYLKAVGVNFVLRKLIASMAAATLEITKDGEHYTLKTISTMKTVETKFRLNEEFDDKLMDGRECKTLFTLEGNVLKQRQRTADGFETMIERDITPEEVTTTIKYKDVQCIRRFRKSSA
ncbi:fatty acid-binding protein, liver-like [Paramacrobiotus metropolitanus]|uniref:fatty acid-binding protein, liver-like n=1 Tax=Paramacrobiotus metropolitanus TaxID=2943436 RepID=UPI002445E5D4|nr:fatty acid-binding protein, liver-like [Paramacrobiotus metropolitanus]